MENIIKQEKIIWCAYLRFLFCKSKVKALTKIYTELVILYFQNYAWITRFYFFRKIIKSRFMPAIFCFLQFCVC